MAEKVEWHKGPGGRSDPRSVGLVRVGDLEIDQRVQRTVDPAKVDRLDAEWDWALAEVFTVTRRPDGAIVVTEGQHRQMGLEQRDPEAKIWVVLVDEVEGTAEEAATALGIAKGRRPHNPIQQWRMRVTAGAPHETEAEKVLSALGLTVTEGRSSRGVAAAGTMMRLIHGTPSKPLSPAAGAELLRKTLSVIGESIPEDSNQSAHRFDGVIIQAVGNLIASHPDLSLARLADRLSERTAAQWLAFRRSATPSWRGVQQIIMTDYNRNLRSGRLA